MICSYQQTVANKNEMSDSGEIEAAWDQTERFVEGTNWHQPDAGWQRNAYSLKRDTS
jgi:hypothetical protein